jgi:hypothetical protein
MVALVEGSLFTSQQARDFQEEDEDNEPENKPVRRRDRGKMPVASEGAARAASKATWRSRRVSKWISHHSDGIRNRRRKHVR